MKICFLSIIALLCFSFGYNAYAEDQYIQNLHSQEMNHYESLGYQFKNIDCLSHPLAPMETKCFEVTKPQGTDGISIQGYLKGEFRKEVALRIWMYKNNQLEYKLGWWRQYVDFEPVAVGLLNMELGKNDIEGKFCVQNVSRVSKEYITFKTAPVEE